MGKILMIKILIIIIPFISIVYIISRKMKKSYKKFFYWFIILILFFLVGFQVDFGTDYKSYVDFFLGNRFYPTSKGILFKYLYEFLRLISKNPRILFIVMSFLYFFILNKIIILSKKMY